jgi:hypothetical protein
MSNTNEKIKHLPINLFLSLGSFGISFSALLMIQDNNYVSFFVALVIYLNNAMTASQIDYLDEQIKKLKDEQSVS